MEVRLTSSARGQLLDTVVALREKDRTTAVDFVRRVSGTLVALGKDPEVGADLRAERGLDRGADGVRFLYRVRDETVWVLTVLPESEAT